jgi:fructose-bisphosphate aldolase class 1
MGQHETTREDIDALLEFLPRLEQQGRTFAKWSEMVKNADGSCSLPYPVYDEDVQGLCT